jgi:putative flippase GtrA
MEKFLRHEKVRFLITGCFNTGFDFILLNTLVFVVGAYPLVANTISVTIGITISYILNHKFVFKSDGRLSIKKYLVFFAVTGFSSLVIQNSIIYGFQLAGEAQWGYSIPIVAFVMDNDALRLNIAKATAVLAGMVWNFTLYKFVIFRKKQSGSIESHPKQADA